MERCPSASFARFWTAPWCGRVCLRRSSRPPLRPRARNRRPNDRCPEAGILTAATYNPPGPCGGIDLKAYPLLRRNRTHRGRLALWVILLLMVAAGCTSKRAGDDVSATVDGRKIYRADVEKYYQNQTVGSDQQPVGAQATSPRLSILRQLISN